MLSICCGIWWPNGGMKVVRLRLMLYFWLRKVAQNRPLLFSRNNGRKYCFVLAMPPSFPLCRRLPLMEMGRTGIPHKRFGLVADSPVTAGQTTHGSP